MDRRGHEVGALELNPTTRVADVAFSPSGDELASAGEDGTVRLGAAALSTDGTWFGYGLSTGGSDWLELQVMETATRRVLPDRIRWVKFSAFGWYGDGFFYSRYPAPDDSASALSGSNEHHEVYYHRLGTSQG